MPDMGGIWQGVLAVGWQVAILVAVGILRALGVDIFVKLHKLYNLCALLVRIAIRKPLILLYTDCDEEVAVTHTLARQLRSSLASDGKKIGVVAIADPEKLLSWPLLPKSITAIILLVTDVTPLSVDSRKRDAIQRRLVSYCDGGGILILGHDILYRRVQNGRLQRLAGSRLVKFSSLPNGAKYTKLTHGTRASGDRALIDKLPDAFLIDEPEILSGSWASDVEFLYVLDGMEDCPLVTRRTSGTGCVFWVNVGDQVDEGPPKAIAQPAPEFVKLLCFLIYCGLG